jgi:hypothetical protein
MLQLNAAPSDEITGAEYYTHCKGFPETKKALQAQSCNASVHRYYVWEYVH